LLVVHLLLLVVVPKFLVLLAPLVPPFVQLLVLDFLFDHPKLFVLQELLVVLLELLFLKLLVVLLELLFWKLLTVLQELLQKLLVVLLELLPMFLLAFVLPVFLFQL